MFCSFNREQVAYRLLWFDGDWFNFDYRMPWISVSLSLVCDLQYVQTRQDLTYFELTRITHSHPLVVDDIVQSKLGLVLSENGADRLRQ
jgi:hypothetical protein